MRSAATGVGLALAGGLAWYLTLTPISPTGGPLWWLGPVGAALVYASGKDQPWPRRLGVGLAAAAGLYVPGLWWVIDFHAAGYVLLLALEVGLLGLALTTAPPGAGRALGFPLALALGEALRSSFPFGGLPLTGLDLGQVGGPLVQAARLGGQVLVVALVGSAGVALHHLAVMARSRIRPDRKAGVAAGPPASLTVGAAALVMAVAGSVAGATLPDGQPAGEVATAVVQGGGPRGLRAVDVDPRGVFAAHLRATDGVSGEPELILWPEDVVDVVSAVDETVEGRALAAVARQHQATLVVGVVEDAEAGRGFRNSAVAWGPRGEVVDRTEKVHRVPFGEYIPWRSTLEGLVDLSAVPRDALVGEGPGVLDTDVGRLGVSISFEVFFADRARAAVSAGGQVLLVPTNASSYRGDQVPDQEVAAARLRAIETGRWVVQAAPTGYSAVVDHRGRVARIGPLGDAAVLEAVVGLRTGRTPFLVTGGRPWLVLAVAGLASSWLLHRYHKKS